MLAGRAIDAIELDPGGDAEREHPADAGGDPRRRLRVGDDLELVRPREGDHLGTVVEFVRFVRQHVVADAHRLALDPPVEQVHEPRKP